MSRSAIPAPLTQVLEIADAWLPAAMGRVEARLGEIVAETRGPLAEDAETTLAAGGKRLRPLLVLVCADAGAVDAALAGAVAIELVHMATLVHDDVLDDAPLRRGRPTVLATSGRERATAAGDLLFSRAFAELAERAGEREVGLLSSASLALARGELAQRADAYDASISAERYLHRCELKTAALFECACEFSAPDDALAVFGRRIGLAFQLLDDVLDVTGPPARTGKARGTDLLDGTVTLPLILARDRDASLSGTDLRKLTPAAAEDLCERIVATGVVEEVRDEAREHVRKAKRLLGEAKLDPERRRLLDLLADGVVERYA